MDSEEPSGSVRSGRYDEIEAKTLLGTVKQPDPWFGLKYNMNLYRGCQHQCIYCDTRSECYGIDDLGRVAVKVNAIELLRDELSRKRVRGTIGTGSMNDPYMPLEREVRQTGRALEVIAEFRFPVHVVTKSDLVLRDRAVLREIARVYAAVSFTLTTTDDELARKVEPGAPRPSRRLAAMRQLADDGVTTGVALMPVLPFLEDDPENIIAILERAADAGATYVIPGMGMTLRDRQRAFYYARLDELFPGLKERYIKRFGGAYGCAARDVEALTRTLAETCARLGLATRIPQFEPQAARQPRLL
ncbi:MAG: radical SAM protein [Anaerolineae bacterium]